MTGKVFVHYEKLSQSLLEEFNSEQIFIQRFEDTVSERLEGHCRLRSDGERGWHTLELSKHNEKKQANGVVFTGKNYTFADILRHVSRTLRVLNSGPVKKIKKHAQPVVRAMDKLVLSRKTVRTPSEQESIELRSFLEEETSALQRYFGIKYE